MTSTNGMKMGCERDDRKNLMVVFLFCLLMIGFSACQSTEKEWVSTPSLVSLSDTPTIPHSDIPTRTTPSLYPTASSTPELTPTTSHQPQCPTAQAPLSVAERDQRIKAIIENEECTFPCIFGIQPEDDADQILDTFSTIYHECYLRTPYPPALSEKQLSYISIPIYGIPYESDDRLDFDPAFGSIFLYLYHLENQVKIIFLNVSDPFQSASNTPVLTQWTTFDPHNILKKYGEPDSVLFDIRYYTGIEYDLYLYYNDISTVYIATGKAALSDPMRICPIIEKNWNGKITKFRFLSSTQEHYPDISTLIEFPTFDERTKSITDLGYTIEEFVAIMLSENPIDRCVYIPQNMWEE